MEHHAEPGASTESPAYGRGTAHLEAALRRDIAVLQRLARTLDAPRVDSHLASLLERLDARTLNVLVLGEFNRGKSALINSLLGEEVLPVGAAPTTYVGHRGSVRTGGAH